MTNGPDRLSRRSSRAEEVYARWVREHCIELFRFAYRICGDREIAEDLVQETFYEAWKCRSRLREENRARAWLFQILRNRFARWRKTEKRGPFQISIDAVNLEIVSADSGDGPAEHDELQKALDCLSDRLKLPLLMVLVQGMSCQEAANNLDLPLGTVLSRIHRAKKRLRESLRIDEEDQSASADERISRFRIGGQP